MPVTCTTCILLHLLLLGLSFIVYFTIFTHFRGFHSDYLEEPPEPRGPGESENNKPQRTKVHSEIRFIAQAEAPIKEFMQIPYSRNISLDLVSSMNISSSGRPQLVNISLPSGSENPPVHLNGPLSIILALLVLLTAVCVLLFILYGSLNWLGEYFARRRALRESYRPVEMDNGERRKSAVFYCASNSTIITPESGNSITGSGTMSRLAVRPPPIQTGVHERSLNKTPEDSIVLIPMKELPSDSQFYPTIENSSTSPEFIGVFDKELEIIYENSAAEDYQPGKKGE